MKKVLFILALLSAACMYAQQEAPQTTQGNCYGFLPGFPEHYCECIATSVPFSFPLETQVTDTMWFVTSIDDLKQGLSAYWFANSTITFEIYAFCSSQFPTMTLTAGANQMREMDAAVINRKLDEMGDMAATMGSVLTPHVKVYPNGGTGIVYCYPFDQGPLSTCDSLLPVIPGMTYVCSDSAEVYELKPNRISTNGNGFIRWKQKQNLSGRVRLTEGSCDGPEIANVTMSDSLRVLVLDAERMRAAKTAGNSVFVHVTHPANYVGRIIYRNTITWDEQQIDTTLCQGKGLSLADTVLTQTTVYPNDTLWKNGDTLSLTTYHLTMEAPVPVYDTLLLKASQLPTTYHNQYIARDAWGDHDFTIHQANQCDERYLVHVEHDVLQTETVIHDTLCMGKTKTYGDVVFSADTVIRDTAWIDADTWAIRDITIHFTEPELEYDTIAIPAAWIIVNGGYWYSDLGVMVKDFGDTLIVKTKKNQCTRWIQLHVEEREVGTELDAVPANAAPAYKIIRDGVMYIRRDGKEYDLTGRLVERQ